MVIDGRRMIVADEGRLRTIDLATRRIDTVAGVPLECPWEPSDGCIRPTDMEIDDRGRLVVVDRLERTIRRVTLP